MTHPKPRLRPVPSTVTTVNLEMGEETTKPMNWHLMPPAPDKCPVCAVKHHAGLPHNPQSLYYQYTFYGATGGKRWPTWADAVAHCAPEMQEAWKRELTNPASGNRWTEPPEGVAPIAHLDVLVAIWTVYERPKDYPQGYVARRFVIKANLPISTEETMFGLTPDDVRAQLPKGLIRIERDPEDEPQIVETWS
jgi:hypothetical protein